jgi:replicative DNA helicase
MPPQSIEAEQSVLGGIMIDHDAFVRVSEMLDETSFYRRDHRVIFRAMGELRDAKPPKPLDAVTLGEWCESNGLAEEIGGSGYLIELASTTPSAANVSAYAEIVAEKAKLRQGIELGTSLVNECFMARGRTSADILGEFQLLLAAVQPIRSTGLTLAHDTMKSWFERFAQRYDEGNHITGLPTPWHDLNQATNGLQDADLIIGAGRPAMGKSIIGGQIAAFTALRGEPVALFSLEMSTTSLHNRNVACLADVPHKFLRAPSERDDRDYLPKMSAAIRQLSKAPLYIDDTPGLTGPQICARAERLHLVKPLRLVVIDHLHIVSIKGRDPNTEIGQNTRLFKGLAKRLNCPVLVLAQLNRKLEDRTDKRPTMADLRASGDIEQDADVVLFFHRPDYYRKKGAEKTHELEVIIGKGRDIEVGEPVVLREAYEYMRAEDWRGERPLPKEEDSPTRTRERWGSVGSRAKTTRDPFAD